MLAEGVAPALIENAARMACKPVNPLAVSGEGSIELQWHVIQRAVPFRTSIQLAPNASSKNVSCWRSAVASASSEEVAAPSMLNEHLRK